MAPAPYLPESALAHILADRLIADLIPSRPVAEMIEIGDALLAAPVPVLTVELGHANSLAVLAEYHRRYGSNILLGASRIRSMGEYTAALRVGAAFYVSDGLLRPVQRHADDHARLCVPVAREIDELRMLLARSLPLMGMRSVSLAAALRFMKAPAPFVVYEIKGDAEVAQAARAGAAAIAVGKALLPERGKWSQAEVIRRARLLRAAWAEAAAQD